MQTTKRCISLLLAAIMVLGMIPASAWVASAKALTQEDIFPPAVRTPEPELIVPMGTTEDGFEYEVYVLNLVVGFVEQRQNGIAVPKIRWIFCDVCC